MGLETGTFTDDLVVTNPPGTDDKRQGDDHLRLIKSVLRNTIKRGNKAFYFPGVITKSADYVVQDVDENLTIVCDTTAGAFTLTLPALDSTRFGWTINVIKSNVQPNPVFIVPTSGTINGYSKVRRTIENAITKVVWAGLWVAERPNGGAPIGSVVEFYGNVLPNGHLWADGAAYTAANFVELNSVVPILPDRRGRSAIGRDGAGPAGLAGRVTVAGSGIDPAILLGAGGTEAVVLSNVNQIPSHSHSVAQSPHSHIPDPHSHGISANQTVQQAGNGAAFAFLQGLADGVTGNNVATSQPAGATSQAANANITINSSGGSASHQNMPPSLVCNAIVVAE